METLRDTQQQLIDDFESLEDWLSKYEYLIDLGRALPDFPEQWKTQANRVHGCQAQVWIHQEKHGDKLHFYATSDAAIVKGLIALLLKMYNDRSAEEILATNTDFIAAIGLDKHLSPTRSNGLYHMLQIIYQSAEVIQ